jgi:hypothetical protein
LYFVYDSYNDKVVGVFVRFRARRFNSLSGPRAISPSLAASSMSNIDLQLLVVVFVVVVVVVGQRLQCPSNDAMVQQCISAMVQ